MRFTLPFSRFTHVAAFLLLLAGAAPGSIHAQLTGTYTLGGASPDYATFADALAALTSQGVSGPVTFNVRAGIYTESGGTARVVDLQQVIAGTSDTNRITFRADPNTGATAENVILERSGGSNEDGYLVWLASDYISFEHLTFRSIGPSSIFYYAILIDDADGSFDGLIFRHCIIETSSPANPYFVGISFDGATTQTQIVDNTFIGPGYGILSSNNSTAAHQDLVIARNTFVQPGRVFSRSGVISIERSPNVVIEDNVLDFTGAVNNTGISIGTSTPNYRIARNQIIHVNDALQDFFGIWARNVGGSHGVIVNNLIAGARFGSGILVSHDNVKIYHNTVYMASGNASGGNSSRALNVTFVADSGIEVVNNIFVNESVGNRSHVMLFGESVDDFVLDGNLLYGASSDSWIEADGEDYLDLAAWQTTGKDLQGISFLPEFRDKEYNLRLDGCSAFNPDVLTFPWPDVTVDVDSTPRSSTQPVRGGHEASGALLELFEPTASYVSGDVPVGIAAADIDGDGRPDLAVANQESLEIEIQRNDGDGTFTPFASLSTAPDRPGIVRAADLDQDGDFDLVVTRSNTASLGLFWNNGSGTFTPMQTLATPHDVADLVVADVNQDGLPDLVAAGGWITGVDEGWVWVMLNQDSQPFVASPTYRATDSPGTLAVTDLNGDNFPDLISAEAITPGQIAVQFNAGITGETWNGWSAATAYDAQIRSAALLPSLVAADVDGDGDTDLVADDALTDEHLVLLRNLGGGVFGARELIFVADSPLRHPETVTAYDHDGDGDLDLLTGNANNGVVSGNVVLLLNDSSGAFSPALVCNESVLPRAPRRFVVADFDSDGAPDVAAPLWTEGAGNDQVAVLLNAASALPVELTTFSVVQDDGGLVLTWTTASETNNHGFEVQHRTATGSAWTPVGFVEGVGTSATGQRYQHRLTGLAPGHHAVRLKQVDVDGTFHYSPERTLVISPSASFLLGPAHPNPFQGSTTLDLVLSVPQHVTVTVHDILGRQFGTILDRTLTADMQHRLHLDATTWPSGLYFVRVSGERFHAVRQVIRVK